MTRTTATEPLLLQRIVLTRPKGCHGTDVLVFTLGGMGDRIVFQAIVHHALVHSTERRRVVAVIPFHGDEYDARQYSPAPDEIWIFPFRPEQIDSSLGDLHRLAGRFFSGDGPVCTRCFAPTARRAAPGTAAKEMALARDIAARRDHGPARVAPAPKLPSVPSVAPSPGPGRATHAEIPGCQWVDPYAELRRLATEHALYPSFFVREGNRERARAALSARGLWPSPQGILAVHCRTRPGDPDKNLHPADVAALVRELRSRLGMRVLAVGMEDVPAELLELADLQVPGEDDSSLQLTGAYLEACAVLVAGDSGPGHLAAAVGTAVLGINAPGRTAVYGPFGPSERVVIIEGTLEHNASSPVIRFDPARALDEVPRLLATPAKPTDPAQGP